MSWISRGFMTMRKSVMLTLLGVLGVLLLAPYSYSQQSQSYTVVSSCNSPTYVAGRVLYGTMDIHGKICSGNSQHPTVTLTLAGISVDTSSFNSDSAYEGHFHWNFGTVVGSYSGCTAQLYTTFDSGSHWLTLGTAASISISTGAVNMWSVFGQGPTTSVTTTAPSSSTAVEFGDVSKLTVICNSYGTSAPVTVNTLLK